MVGEAGSPSRPLSGAGGWRERLMKEPWRFGFFSALRRIEAESPDRPRIGRSVHASEDPVRLGQEPSLAFAPATLAKAGPGKNGGAPWITVQFFGLMGPNGPLPLHVSEYARDRMKNHGDTTLVRFLDLFHHRLLSLFYRAWAQAQPAVSLDRPQEDRFGAFAGTVCGLGMPSLRDRDALPDFAKLFFAGRLGCQAKNPEGLRRMIAEFFAMDCDIHEFSGQWLKLPSDALCRIGESPATGTLGQTAVAGSRIWDCRQRFRIVLGPLGAKAFERLLPGARSGSMERLVALVRNYIGDELSFDVQLVLKKEEVPPLRLGGGGVGARLGWTTWTTSRPPAEDVRDLVLNPLGDVA